MSGKRIKEGSDHITKSKAFAGRSAAAGIGEAMASITEKVKFSDPLIDLAAKMPSVYGIPKITLPIPVGLESLRSIRLNPYTPTFPSQAIEKVRQDVAQMNKTIELLSNVFKGPSFTGFNQAVRIATTSTFQPVVGNFDNDSFFNDLRDIVEKNKIGGQAETSEEKEDASAQIRDIQRQLLLMWQGLQEQRETQAKRFYVSILLFLLSQIISTYRSADHTLLDQVQEIKSSISELKYATDLKNTGELVTNTVARRFKQTRIKTRLLFSPINNSGVQCHLSIGQEVLIIAKLKKYYYVSLADNVTGEVKAGFVLKKHLSNIIDS